MSYSQFSKCRDAKDAGFTLVETMIVVFVTLIITAAAMPSISRTVGAFRVKIGADTLGTKLIQARQESVRRGSSTYLFFDPANSRIYVDFNHNMIPEGTANSNVAAGAIVNEEYNLPRGIELEIRSSASTCFDLPSNAIALKPTEIPSYIGWKYILFDSRGELDFNFRSSNSTCINVNLNPVQSDPAGAVLLYCKQISSGASKYTISLSLRGNVSVLTYKRLP